MCSGCRIIRARCLCKCDDKDLNKISDYYYASVKTNKSTGTAGLYKCNNCRHSLVVIGK